MPLFLQEFVAIPSPAIQQECSSRAIEDEEIRHTQEKASLGRQVLTLLSFLKPFFRVNCRKMYKISSANNPSLVPFQVDCEYCLDGKRNNRNSTVLLCIRFVALSRKNWLQTMFERVIAFKSKAQRLRTC